MNNVQLPVYDEEALKTMSVEELGEGFKFLKVNNLTIRDRYKEMDSITKPYCWNYHKKWNEAEVQTVIQKVDNPFNPICIMRGVDATGRTPLSVVNCWLYAMWRDFKAGRLKLAKRVLRCAVTAGLAGQR